MTLLSCIYFVWFEEDFSCEAPGSLRWGGVVNVRRVRAMHLRVWFFCDDVINKIERSSSVEEVYCSNAPVWKGNFNNLC